MRRHLAQTITAFLTLIPLAVHAAGGPAVPIPDTRSAPVAGDEAASVRRAVGRIDLPGGAYCTGTLIAGDLVLTAAHCLFDHATGLRVPTRDIAYLAGLSEGRPLAVRGVRAAVTHPDFAFTDRDRMDRVAHDLALLQLDAPIDQRLARPLAIETRPRRGATVGVLSYNGLRAETANLRDGCEVMARQGGLLVLTCAAAPGASGSPIFVTGDGGPRIVSVLSAMASVGDREVSLGTALAEPLAELREALADPARTASALEPAAVTPLALRYASEN